jgi:hypothetical protein
MVKILSLIFCLIALPVFAACSDDSCSQPVQLAKLGMMVGAPPATGGAVVKCSGANTYIGNQTTTGVLKDGWSGYWVRQEAAEAWSIGGTGTVDVCSIEAYTCNSDASAGVDFRMAVYDDADNVVCQGSAKVATLANCTTFEWITHVYASSGLTGTCTLDKTKTYRIAVSGDSAKGWLHQVLGANGVDKYGAVQYTEGSGFISPLPGGSAYTSAITVRVGYQ